MKLILFSLLLFCTSTFAIVTCPDGTSGCPDGMTCCLVGAKEYGCCPIEHAVCCADHLHCCPQGNTCDTAHGRCLSATGERSHWRRKGPSFKVQQLDDDSDESPLVESETVMVKRLRPENPRLPWLNNRRQPNEISCADHKSKCPDHTTCCLMDRGVYGCCPVEDAVCCKDHLHCCPHGTKCDVSEGKCINSQNGDSSPWFKKFHATQIHRKPAIDLTDAFIDCDNGEKCAANGKCCMDAENEAHCCPFANGVCCKGAKHCCPHGFRCLSVEGRCIQEENNFMISMAYEPTKDAQEFVYDQKKTICPDNKSFCGAHETCCETYDDLVKQSSYKCCKLNHAICCEDSCCPRGYHCVGGKTCERSVFVGKNMF